MSTTRYAFAIAPKKRIHGKQARHFVFDAIKPDALCKVANLYEAITNRGT